MTSTVGTCLERRAYQGPQLFAAHPPALRNANKRTVFEWLKPEHFARGTLQYSRWAERPWPHVVPSQAPLITVHPGVFDYAGPSDGVWHVNFADPELFCAYGSSLLAQDELQVLEHPVLACLREALVAEGLPAVTAEGDRATPVLVTHVPRAAALDTSAGPERLSGLYGNQFARASVEELKAALTIFNEPALTNLLAIAAPSGGRGRYQRQQFDYIVRTAFTGFAAAREESARLWPGAPVDIRTGFWGCGAFGGNRTVMIALQVLAAQLAGIERLTFYTVTQSGRHDVTEGREALALASRGTTSVTEILERLEARGFTWGVSNGT